MKSMMLFAAVAALALPGAAFGAMTKEQLKAEKQRIEKEYESAKSRCKSYSGNARDVCDAEAKGRNKVALAELEERNDPSDKARHNLKLAKAEAEYEVSREKCDERAGDSKEACVREAQAAFARDKANAKR